MRVLLVEDDPPLGSAVREHLRREGHAVDWVTRLDEADAALRSVEFEMVLLDLYLPDGRGLDLLLELRKRRVAVPVIILTALDRITDRIRGLDAGADDYLVKPFDLRELSARLRAAARRVGGDPSRTRKIGELEIDLADRALCRNGVLVDLSSREWAVLEALLQRPGAVRTKGELEDALYAFGAEVESNTIEVYVSRLRKKLGTEAIETLRGVGYRLKVEA